MPKKDTKLQKLSESIQYTIDEMRGLGIEGLDQLFLWMKGMFWKSIWNCQMGFLPMTPYKDFSLS